MQVVVDRKETIFYPDPSRIIARFLFTGNERATSIIRSVLEMSDEDAIGYTETDAEGLFHASQEYFQDLPKTFQIRSST
jgi:hypothetical protein